MHYLLRRMLQPLTATAATVVTVTSPIGLPSRSALGLVVAGLCASLLFFSGVGGWGEQL